jgi:hypothetical protein
MKLGLKLGEIVKGIMGRVTLAPDGMSRVFKCRHAMYGGAQSYKRCYMRDITHA